MQTGHGGKQKTRPARRKRERLGLPEPPRVGSLNLDGI
jgi:hypothetical protein